MNKVDFLEGLRNGLKGYPQDDVDERLAFYSEMIDDRMEEGLAEEEAVEELGPVDRIVSQIVSDIPLQKLVKEKIKPKRRMRAWEIVLLVVGAPLWIPLLLVAFVLLLVVYVLIWVIVVVLWAVWAALTAGALGGIAAGVILIVQKNLTQGLLMISAGIVSAGLSIFAFYGCLAATKGMALLSKKLALGIKSKLRRKENAQ